MKSEERREGLGSAKRFGARYGRKTKLKFSNVETEQRKLHKCPYCTKIAVKRIALGIWQCRKCNVKFAGKAYSVTRKIVTKEAEEMAEEPQVIEEQAEEQEAEE